MQTKWSDSLSIGIKSIDDQHKELFASLDKLTAAMKAGNGRAEIPGIMSFLENYVKEHFRNEDTLMQANNYPLAKAHSSQHATFICDFYKSKLELEASGVSSYKVIQLKDWVGNWLVEHICKTDKALGEFLSIKKAA